MHYYWRVAHALCENRNHFRPGLLALPVTSRVDARQQWLLYMRVHCTEEALSLRLLIF